MMADRLYLLSSEVLLELAHDSPDAGVTAFMGEAKTFIVSSLFFQDLALMMAQAEGGAREGVKTFAEALQSALSGKVVAVDAALAALSGRFLASRAKSLSPTEALLAATAVQKGAIVVARDAAHFAAAGLEALNPFSGNSAKRSLKPKAAKAAREETTQQAFLF